MRSKADEDGAQAAANAPVKEASVVFVSVSHPPLSLELGGCKASGSAEALGSDFVEKSFFLW